MTIARRDRVRVRGAFTLMELMVVIAIIVVLVGIGGFAYMKTLDDSKVQSAQLKAKGDLTTACKTYKTKVGEYPNQLTDLLQKTSEGFGPFLESEEALLDPWERPYQYNAAGPRNNGMQPDIWTTDPGSGQEIGNWPKGH
jgi:general secretion pathway protein G